MREKKRVLINTVITDTRSNSNLGLPSIADANNNSKADIDFNMLLSYNVDNTSIDKEKHYTLDDALIAAGGFGKNNKFLLILFCRSILSIYALFLHSRIYIR